VISTAKNGRSFAGVVQIAAGGAAESAHSCAKRAGESAPAKTVRPDPVWTPASDVYLAERHEIDGFEAMTADCGRDHLDDFVTSEQGAESPPPILPSALREPPIADRRRWLGYIWPRHGTPSTPNIPQLAAAGFARSRCGIGCAEFTPTLLGRICAGADGRSGVETEGDRMDLAV